MAAIERAVGFGHTVLREARARDVPFMAGSIAYQTFVSLVPLLVLAFLLVALVDDETLARRMLAVAGATLPETGTELLASAVTGRTEGAGASLIGVVTLVWGALRLFRGLDTAFSEIYGTRGEDSLLDQFWDGLVVLVALGGALLAAVGATVAFAIPSSPLGLAEPVVLVVGLAGAFLPMYWRFPDVSVSLRATVPGAVVAAAGWALLQVLFELYVGYASATSAGGTLGAVLLLLVWLYLGSLCLLGGAVVNAVAAGYDRAIPERMRAGVDTGFQVAPSPASPPGTASTEAPVQAGADDLARENRRLRAALSWYRQPLWRRLRDRLLGEGPPDTETPG